MVNLVYVGNFRPQVGGAAIYCNQILCELARRGCRSRVLASVTEDARIETLAFDQAADLLEIRRFEVPYYFGNPQEPVPRDWEVASLNGVRAGLEEMIADAAPDVLLVRESWAPFTNEIAARHGIPTIALVLGNPTSAILGGLFPKAAGAAFLAELGKTNLIVTVAEHFIPGLSELGLNNARSIPNAVDLSRFSPRGRDRELARQFGIADSDMVVFHASQLKPIKRPLDIVRSAPAVLRRNPDVLYFILGEGENREEMRSLTAELGVSGRFRFEPFVAHEQVPRYMSLADIVVMPSEREGQSGVYLETLACKKTLIASDIPAAREVIDHGESGLLFRKADIADLAEKTLLAAEDADLRSRIGKRALERVQRHSLLVVGEQYLAAIREVVT